MTFQQNLKLFGSRIKNRGAQNTFRLARNYIRNFFEHASPLKVANLSVIKVQKWLRRDRLIGMPYIYTIDPINVCNLRCPLCPTGLGILGRDRGKISIERYQSIIDQVKDYAFKVYLYNWGEPFLHPEIFEIISYTASRRIEVHLSSNMNRFSAEMAEKVIDSGLDSLLVSMDGATQEVYERYRRRGNLAQVVENLKTLVAAKKRRGSAKPYIYLRVIINKHNENQIDAMRQMADEIGVDAFTIGSLYIDTTNPEQAKEWLPTDERFSPYDYSKPMVNTWHCSDLWESMTINWDGGVAPCCWLHNHKNDIANIFDQPVKELWNGDSYISSRRVFALGGEKAGPVKNICTVCKGKPMYLKD